MKKIRTLLATSLMVCAMATSTMAAGVDDIQATPTSDTSIAATDTVDSIADTQAVINDQLKFEENVPQTGDGFTWNEVGKILTITDLTINADEDEALIVPAGTEIIIDGICNIIATDDDGIKFKGENSCKITINAGAELNITAKACGINAEQASLTIANEGELTIDSEFVGVLVDSNFTHNGNGTMDIEAKKYGFYINSDDSSNVTFNGKVNITSTEQDFIGIYINGNSIVNPDDTTNEATIFIGDDANIEVESETCISFSDQWDTLNIVNDGTLKLNNISDYHVQGIEAYSTAVEISGDGTLTSDGEISCISYKNNGNTVNAIVNLRNLEKVFMNTTVYGDVTIANNEQAEWLLCLSGSLSFAEDSKLTINEGVDVTFNDRHITDNYNIAWANADIVNNGTINFKDDENTYKSIDFTKITGNGNVCVLTWYTNIFEWMPTQAYDNNGDAIIIDYEGNLILQAGEAFDGGLYGFTWTDEDNDGSYDTLTVGEKGLTIKSDEVENPAGALTVPDGTKIVLNGDLNIESAGLGLYADGNVEISGTGKLNIKADKKYGIQASGNITITDKVNVDIAANMYGIEAKVLNGDAQLNITTTGTVNLKDCSIHTVSNSGNTNITIENATVNIDGWQSIYSENGKLTIEDANVTMDNIEVAGVNIINSEINANSLSSNEGGITIDATSKGEVWSIYSDGNITIADGAGIKVLDSIQAGTTATFPKDIMENGTYVYGTETDEPEMEIYGDVKFDYLDIDDLYMGGNITLTEGAKLTIETNATLDLNAQEADPEYPWIPAKPEGSIDFSKGTLVVDGMLVYPNDTEVSTSDFDAISGEGYIIVNGKYYTTDHKDVSTVTGEIDLGVASVTEDEYTWTVENGVGTLTIPNETLFDCSITVENVENVIIEVGDNVTVTSYIEIDYSMPKTNLTIKGEGSFIVNELNANSNDLTIDCDVRGTICCGDLVVNGNLESKSIQAVNMTVNTGATFKMDNGYGVILLTNEESEPTLTLGKNVGILTPANGGYVTNLYDIAPAMVLSSQDMGVAPMMMLAPRYMGTITTDGEELADDYSNIAHTIYIGYKAPASTGGSSSGGSSSTVTKPETTTGEDGSVTATVASTSKTSNGTTSVAVDDKKVDTAIDAAISEADGEDAHLEISVPTKSSTDKLDVEISKDSLEKIAKSDVENLNINSDLAKIEISSDTLEKIVDQAGDDVKISVDTDKKLNSKQETAMGNVTAVELAIESDGENVDLAGEKITVSLPYELKKGEVADKVVVWQVAEDGIITEIPVAYDEKTGMATFETADLGVFAVVHDSNEFKDVKVNDYFYQAVAWAVENDVTKGASAESFAPNETCTRAEAVTFLYRAYGEPKVATNAKFGDVSADAYYANAVAWAVEMGITNGVSDTKFDPNAKCTRGQIASFLHRAAGEPSVAGNAEFNDVLTDAYYADAVAWAVENSVTNGTSDTTFEANTNCTRGQIVTFLYRYIAD